MAEHNNECEQLDGTYKDEAASLVRRVFDLCVDDIIEGRSASAVNLGIGQDELSKLLPADINGQTSFEVSILSSANQTDTNLLSEYDLAFAVNFESLGWTAEKLLSELKRISAKQVFITNTPDEWLPKSGQGGATTGRSEHTGVSALIDQFHRAGYMERYSEDFYVEEWNARTLIFQLVATSPAGLPHFYGCVGCGNCAAACPTGALKMEFDSEGFVRPEMEDSLCVGCNACIDACPALKLDFSNSLQPRTYALWAREDIRERSSSGGAFTLFAERFLSQSNSYVSGAKYNSQTQTVEHIIIDDVEQLDSLRRSKYVQSDTRQVFAPIKQLLEDGARVLFVGCPCQVAALKVFVGSEYSNHLFVIDFICEGVQPPLLLKDHINAIAEASEIKDINFRTKRHGWSPFYFTVEKNDGTYIERALDEDSYEQMVHSFATLRQCCQLCPFATFPRQGDLTIGDFWGVQNYDPAFDDGLGTSFLSVNNIKGARLFESARNDAQLLAPVDKMYTGTNRITPRLYARMRLPQTRNRFYHEASKLPLNDAVQKALHEHYDIGVVANWGGYNLGATLTQYAFYQTLSAMGYDVLMIERPKMSGVLGNCDTPPLFRMNPYPDYALCRRYDSIEEMKDINRYADTFIVPSDQLWNSAFAEKDLFALGIIRNDKFKLSYATSFGQYPHNWTKADRSREGFFLGQLDAISVREDTGVDILSEAFGLDGTCVLDPIFICPEEPMEMLAARSIKVADSATGVIFLLDPTQGKVHFATKVAQLKCASILRIGDPIGDVAALPDWYESCIKNVYVEDWLSIFKSCGFVVTDSYHGVCLAILLEKPFIAIANRKRGETRFVSLLHQLQLDDRLIYESDLGNYDIQKLGEIDYAGVGRRLDVLREQSRGWLAKQLHDSRPKNLTGFDINGARIDRVDSTLRSLEDRINQSDEQIWKAHEIANEAIIRIGAAGDEIWKAQSLANDALSRIGAAGDEIWKAQSLANDALSRIGAAGDELWKTNARVDALEQANVKIAELERTTKRLSKELGDMVKVKRSCSYRIGRAITFIPRAIKRLVHKN